MLDHIEMRADRIMFSWCLFLDIEDGFYDVNSKRFNFVSTNMHFNNPNLVADDILDNYVNIDR